ncbi:MAG: hypothetical protein ABR950_00385 [Candidatus Dormibacteria bacterium]
MGIGEGAGAGEMLGAGMRGGAAAGVRGGAGAGMRGGAETAAASADPAPTSRWKAIGARGAGGGTAGGSGETGAAGVAARPSERVGPGEGGGPHGGGTGARRAWGCTRGTPVHPLDAQTWWLLTEKRSAGQPPSSPAPERGLAWKS